MTGERPRWALRLQAEREARGWNKKEMARRLQRAEGLHQGSPTNLARQIRRWEAGEVFPRDWATAYALAFEVPLDELFAGTRLPGLDAERRQLLVSRGLLRADAAAQTDDMSVLADLFGAVGPLGVNGRPVDAGYVESVRRTNQALVRLDTVHGGSGLLPYALRLFREVHDRVGAGVCDRQVERDLVAAAGETGEIAAWIAYDADRPVVSRQLIHEALMLSRQAGDRSMELFELAHLSMLSLSLHRPAEALRIADGLSEGGGLTPRVAALFDIRRGRALAQLGDERGAFAALDRARAAVADGISARDPRWAWWMDDTEIARQRSMVHAQFGQWRQAVALREEVLAGLSGSSARLDLAQLLEALVHVGDWPRAEQVLPEATGLAATLGPCRTTGVLRDTADHIGRTTAAPSTITDPARHLRRLLDAASADDMQG